MAEQGRKPLAAPEGLFGSLTRRDVIAGAAAGFVTLGLKQAVAESRVTGRPVLAAFGNDCGALNRLIPAGPGPEYDRLLQEGIADPKGFLTRRFSFTKTQQAALDAATPAEVEAIRGALRTAGQKNLKLNFTCWAPVAPAGGMLLHSSARLHIASFETASPAGAQAPAAKLQGSAQAMAVAPLAFRGTLTLSSPQIR